MRLEFKKDALDDLCFWQNSDKKKLRKIFSLIENIQDTPFTGLGKPEALKNELSGLWSRRIDREHRLVYRVQENIITIYQCRYHY